MSESNELFAAVNFLKHKVEGIEKIEALILRGNKDMKNDYISYLSSDNLLFLVYKEIDGSKTQREIANIINTSDMNVSYKIKKLLELCLIEVKDISNGKIYKHTIIEQVFKLTKVVNNVKRK